jgi:hypothetical protein
MNCHAFLCPHSNNYESNCKRYIQKGGVAYLHNQPLRRKVLSLRYVSECGGNKQSTHAQKQPLVLLWGATFDEGGKIVNIRSKKAKWICRAGGVKFTRVSFKVGNSGARSEAKECLRIRTGQRSGDWFSQTLDKHFLGSRHYFVFAASQLK